MGSRRRRGVPPHRCQDLRGSVGNLSRVRSLGSLDRFPHEGRDRQTRILVRPVAVLIQERPTMPYGTPPRARQLEHGKFNRFLATLPPHDFSLLAPHLRTIALERGVMLYDVGEEIDHVYFPHTGMVSLVAVMQSGATVETATIGRGGVIGASAALGARWTFGRAVVPLPGAAAWLPAAQFRAAANQSEPLRALIVRYNDLLLAQVQQSVACNALHALEARLCRWLLQT